MKKRILTMLGLAAVFAIAAGDAMAAGGGLNSQTVVGAAISKSANVFQSVRTIVFVIGGFGLVGIAYQAIIGKVKWGWFAGLAVGLALLAAAGAIVDYATGAGLNGKFADSFNADGSSTVPGPMIKR